MTADSDVAEIEAKAVDVNDDAGMSGEISGGARNTSRRRQVSKRTGVERLSTPIEEVLAKYRIENIKHKERVYSVLSLLYAIFLMAIGVTLPVAEIFAQNNRTVFVGSFEGFYVYLFATSLLFLLFVHIVIVRDILDAPRLQCIRTPSGNQWGTSKAECAGEVSPTNSEIDMEGDPRLKAWPKGGNRNMSMNSHAHSGSFYLRLGAVGFGIGNIIHEGLQFGRLLEEEYANPAPQGCSSLRSATLARPILQLVFTFCQMYFIFGQSKMIIHRFRIAAKFGLMHLVATNLCVWFRIITTETLHDLHSLQSSDAHGNDDSHTQEDLDDDEVFCNGGGGHHVASGFLAQAVDAVSPYLYACTVEYSLILAGVFYLMWHNVRRREERQEESSPSDQHVHQATSTHHTSHVTHLTTGYPTTDSKDNSHRTHQRSHTNDSHCNASIGLQTGSTSNHNETTETVKHISVNFSGSNRGLFLGILVLIATIISLVVFFALSTGSVPSGAAHGGTSHGTAHEPPSHGMTHDSAHDTPSHRLAHSAVHHQERSQEHPSPDEKHHKPVTNASHFPSPRTLNSTHRGRVYRHAMNGDTNHGSNDDYVDSDPVMVASDDLPKLRPSKPFVNRRAVKSYIAHNNTQDAQSLAAAIRNNHGKSADGLGNASNVSIRMLSSDQQSKAVIVMYATEIILYVLTGIAVGSAAYQFNSFKFNGGSENSLDEVLIIIALIGVYIFSVFSHRASVHILGPLLIATEILTILQSTIQTMFILNGLRRSVSTSSQESLKPGRQYVTFLVVANTALWAVNSFELLKATSHPVQMTFYGELPWSLITHVSVPLAIFYRYHSTVCLAEIWNEAYEKKGDQLIISVMNLRSPITRK